MLTDLRSTPPSWKTSVSLVLKRHENHSEWAEKAADVLNHHHPLFLYFCESLLLSESLSLAQQIVKSFLVHSSAFNYLSIIHTSLPESQLLHNRVILVWIEAVSSAELLWVRDCWFSGYLSSSDSTDTVWSCQHLCVCVCVIVLLFPH